MGGFNSIIPGTGAAALWRNHEAPIPPRIPVIEKGSDSSGLSGRMTSHANPQTVLQSRKANEPAASQPDVQLHQGRQGKPDPNALTGPSPAFQASLLELELDLQNSIARTQAARSRRESEIASGIAQSPTAQPEPADKKAEVKEGYGHEDPLPPVKPAPSDGTLPQAALGRVSPEPEKPPGPGS
jgi:hypothetical protein